MANELGDFHRIFKIKICWKIQTENYYVPENGKIVISQFSCNFRGV